MFRQLLVLALGAALGISGAQMATAARIAQTAPAVGADIILVGHRHTRGHVSRGYHRSYRDARPRYRSLGHYRPRHGHHRGYGQGYRGRYPAYGSHYNHRRGYGYNARQNYLRDRYGK